MIEYENLARVNQPFIQEFQDSFVQTLQRGWFILGQNVSEFEDKFARYNHSSYCVGVASGLDALILSLLAFSFQKNSEVIVPSNTYIATILSIVRADLRPILVEPDLRTYNIDPDRIEEKINKNTAAIMVVHLYGKPCDMEPILYLCKKYNLKLIEDCAQAHGARYKGQFVGTFGDFGAFSFYPTKNLGALGDGGAVLTDDESLYRRVKMLRNYGSEKKYYNSVVGFNSRLDEIQAGFLLAKLQKLDEINSHKRRLAELYLEKVNDNFVKPVVGKDFVDVFHIFPIRHPKRNELQNYLFNNSIKTEIHYPISPNKQPAMAGILDDQLCPIAEKIHSTVLSLPISFAHSEEDVLKVAEVLNSFRG